MNVVADCSAVPGAVVCIRELATLENGYISISSLTITKDKQLVSLSDSDLSKQWQQVIRNTLRIFSHDTARMRACGVEVPQHGAVPFFPGFALLLCLVTLCLYLILDHALDHDLGLSVCVRRANRATFRDRNHVWEARRISVYCCGRRENYVGDMVLLHRAQETQTAVDIDAVVLERDLTRLPNSLNWSAEALNNARELSDELSHLILTYLECREVDYIVNVRMLRKYLVECGFICNIDLIEVWTLARDQLYAVDNLLRRVVAVVDNNDLVVSFEESEDGEGANITGASDRIRYCDTLFRC